MLETDQHIGNIIAELKDCIDDDMPQSSLVLRQSYHFAID